MVGVCIGWLWSYSLEQSKEESQETTESLIGGEEVVDNDLISTIYDVFRFRNEKYTF